MCFMAVCHGCQLSKLAARISEPFVKCLQRLNNQNCIAKTRFARTNYLNLIYFCRKYTIFTKFYEFMLQKVVKIANYAVAVLVSQIMLFSSNYAKNYASTIYQSLLEPAIEKLLSVVKFKQIPLGPLWSCDTGQQKPCFLLKGRKGNWPCLGVFFNENVSFPCN